MSTPPPLQPASNWDVPSIRIAALALAAGNAAFWIYIFFPFVYAHADPNGDGFDMLLVMPFTAIFFAPTLPSAARAIGGRGYGLALGLVLGATVLNAIIFLALTSSTLPPRAEPSQQKSGLAAASLQLRVRLYQ